MLDRRALKVFKPSENLTRPTGRLSELDDVRRLDPGAFDPGEFLPAAYRSVDELEGFLEHLIRDVHDPALRGVGESVVVSTIYSAKGLEYPHVIACGIA